jgi:hypothetical protein
MTDQKLAQTLLFVKQRSGKRNRLKVAELSHFKEFLVQFCPTPSGAKTEKFKRTLPIDDLYQNFIT